MYQKSIKTITAIQFKIGKLRIIRRQSIERADFKSKIKKWIYYCQKHLYIKT